MNSTFELVFKRVENAMVGELPVDVSQAAERLTEDGTGNTQTHLSVTHQPPTIHNRRITFIGKGIYDTHVTTIRKYDDEVQPSAETRVWTTSSASEALLGAPPDGTVVENLIAANALVHVSQLLHKHALQEM